MHKADAQSVQESAEASVWLPVLGGGSGLCLALELRRGEAFLG